MKKYSIYVLAVLIIIVIGFSINKYVDSNMLLITTDENLDINYTNYKDLKTMNKILSFPKSTYHTGILIGEDLFYNKKDGAKNTQLYSYNKKDKKEKQLTDKETSNIVNVDYMCKGKDKLFIRILRDGHRNFNLASLDLKNEKITIYNKDEQDKSLLLFDYCEKNNIGIELVFSSNEYYKNIKEANENKENLKNVDYTILFSKDEFKSETEIGCIKNMIITSLDLNKDGTKFIYTAKKNSEYRISIYEYNIDENVTNKIFDGDEHTELTKINNVKYSKDNNYIYFTATKEDKGYKLDSNGEEYKPNSLMVYNLKNNQLDTKLELENDTINYISY